MGSMIFTFYLDWTRRWIAFSHSIYPVFHYSHSRKTYSGFTAWVAGISGMTVAALLLGLRGVIPDIFTVIIANGVGAT